MTPTAKAVAMSLLACSVGATAAAQGTRGAAPSERAPVFVRPATPSAAGLQGYSVVLVVGDMQQTGGADTVPPAARKALTDMQAFLPYKRYQLLDAAWMLCCGTFRVPIAGRMRGPEDREYSYSIETTSAEDNKLTVRFTMREVDAPSFAVSGVSRGGVAAGGVQHALTPTARIEYTRQFYEAEKERDDADIQMQRTKKMHDVGTASTTELEAATRRYQLARTRVESLERTLAASQNTVVTSGSRGSLLDSTFSIAVGETVVIGTSRLKGDQALIALLTAAGKPGAR